MTCARKSVKRNWKNSLALAAVAGLLGTGAAAARGPDELFDKARTAYEEKGPAAALPLFG